jgi:rubrerythrin
MAKRKLITQDQKTRIADLAAKGLTDIEIAGALKIAADTVRKYKQKMEVKKDGSESTKSNIEAAGPKRPAGSRRHRDPGDNLGEKEPGESCNNNHDLAGEKIVFVGGKKHGDKTMKNEQKEGKEEFEWECPGCHHQWNGTPDKCPKCGKELKE